MVPSLSASTRAMASVMLPAPNGTMIVTDRLGQDCATAPEAWNRRPEQASAAMPIAMQNFRKRTMDVLPIACLEAIAPIACLEAIANAEVPSNGQQASIR